MCGAEAKSVRNMIWMLALQMLALVAIPGRLRTELKGLWHLGPQGYCAHSELMFKWCINRSWCWLVVLANIQSYSRHTAEQQAMMTHFPWSSTKMCFSGKKLGCRIANAFAWHLAHWTLCAALWYEQQTTKQYQRGSAHKHSILSLHLVMTLERLVVSSRHVGVLYKSSLYWRSSFWQNLGGLNNISLPKKSPLRDTSLSSQTIKNQNQQTLVFDTNNLYQDMRASIQRLPRTEFYPFNRECMYFH